ncbi:MAG TPA: tRNA pseudouridine synthase A [Solirubrobacteraceae bacterium]|jgi:tRNA pseudouridine38-40 synthase|nr:tRNA pseudouridine synthase A [Solirubrobacteraceae bacterium]
MPAGRGERAGALVTKLTLEYDGADFGGWARQPGLRTVQEEVERALHAILGEQDADGAPLTLTVAGRTDRGVHAWGQVASYRHEALDPLRLNALLPPDVTVLTSEPAPAGFDARHDARSRTYCYRILARRARSVFMRGSALWWPHAIDRDALHACAKALVGTHDFTAFTPTETDHVRFERDVLRAEWRTIPPSPACAGAGGQAARAKGDGGQAARAKQDGGQAAPTKKRDGSAGGGLAAQGDLLEFWIEADTFMRHMNRVLVGTMLEVAGGRRTLDDFSRLLEGRPRPEGGPTAPAHGLALASVAYGCVEAQRS